MISAANSSGVPVTISFPPWTAMRSTTSGACIARKVSALRRSTIALDVPAGGTVLHVGDSLRYDVAGALAAGLQPVHMDPYGFCPAPGGHPHVRSLAELAGALISTQRLSRHGAAHSPGDPFAWGNTPPARGH